MSHYRPGFRTIHWQVMTATETSPPSTGCSVVFASWCTYVAPSNTCFFGSTWVSLVPLPNDSHFFGLTYDRTPAWAAVTYLAATGLTASSCLSTCCSFCCAADTALLASFSSDRLSSTQLVCTRAPNKPRRDICAKRHFIFSQLTQLTLFQLSILPRISLSMRPDSS